MCKPGGVAFLAVGAAAAKAALAEWLILPSWLLNEAKKINRKNLTLTGNPILSAMKRQN